VAPRVILSEATFESLKSTMPSLKNSTYLLADDGPPYLHVLQDIGVLNARPVTAKNRRAPDILNAQHCQQIVQSLLDKSIHDPRHFEKTRWFAIYWNATVGFAPGALIAPVRLPVMANLNR
jgi:hypothetical protein